MLWLILFYSLCIRQWILAEENAGHLNSTDSNSKLTENAMIETNVTTLLSAFASVIAFCLHFSESNFFDFKTLIPQFFGTSAIEKHPEKVKFVKQSSSELGDILSPIQENDSGNDKKEYTNTGSKVEKEYRKQSVAEPSAGIVRKMWTNVGRAPSSSRRTIHRYERLSQHDDDGYYPSNVIY
ncbi:unnamed protein product [Thelazia callipaeda]|uniref:Uncharacterized protein n=1 Tax=Thelazia callipaeda TaxID=103827 RepID=A0A0N5CKX4_THECL|nr:unnamed protein product [Thelazia callipaeda]